MEKVKFKFRARKGYRRTDGTNTIFTRDPRPLVFAHLPTVVKTADRWRFRWTANALVTGPRISVALRRPAGNHAPPGARAVRVPSVLLFGQPVGVRGRRADRIENSSEPVQRRDRVAGYANLTAPFDQPPVARLSRSSWTLDDGPTPNHTTLQSWNSLSCWFTAGCLDWVVRRRHPARSHFGTVAGSSGFGNRVCTSDGDGSARQ